MTTGKKYIIRKSSIVSDCIQRLFDKDLRGGQNDSVLHFF